MSRYRLLTAALLGLLLVTAAAAQTAIARPEAGDPGRGAVLYVSNGCGACHVLREAGSSGTTGPDLDRWLATHAAFARLTPDLFALSRITWGGRGMPAYTGVLSGEELDDLVSYVLGTPFTAPETGVGQVPPSPAPPPLVVAAAATVRSWATAKKLTGTARRGASLFATTGCLSCHTYLGSGRRSFGGPDLTRGGPSRPTAARLRRLIAQPPAFGSTRMPSFGDLPDADLRALADFLVASRR